jgi:mannose-1-phosphate guanylyltransferase
MLVHVIMASGSGTRLWPLSRSLYPKQFLPLASDRTMLQETVLRLKGLKTAAPVTICNEEHRFIVAEQLRAIDQLGTVILEPEGRNTAPAVALAAHVISNENDPLLLILAADHVIENESTYISVGAIHTLKNPGKTPLELIEVQSGSYLGEDDIVRFEDLYGRA